MEKMGSGQAGEQIKRIAGLFLEGIVAMLIRAMGLLTPNVLVLLTLAAIFIIFPNFFRFCFLGKRRFWISVSLVILFVSLPPSPFKVISKSWNLSDAPTQREIIEKVRENIFLAERYGGEWHKTNDEAILFLRRNGEPDILRKAYNPNLPEEPGLWPRFTPQLCHNVRGLLIPRATIYLKIPNEITVAPLPSHVPPPQDQEWTLAKTDDKWKHYYTTVVRATDRLSAGVMRSLALKFPKAGQYPIEYIVSPQMGVLGGDIHGTFYVEMTE